MEMGLEPCSGTSGNSTGAKAGVAALDHGGSDDTGLGDFLAKALRGLSVLAGPMNEVRYQSFGRVCADCEMCFVFVFCHFFSLDRSSAVLK